MSSNLTTQQKADVWSGVRGASLSIFLVVVCQVIWKNWFVVCPTTIRVVSEVVCDVVFLAIFVRWYFKDWRSYKLAVEEDDDKKRRRYAFAFGMNLPLIAYYVADVLLFSLSHVVRHCQ